MKLAVTCVWIVILGVEHNKVGIMKSYVAPKMDNRFDIGLSTLDSDLRRLQTEIYGN